MYSSHFQTCVPIHVPVDQGKTRFFCLGDRYRERHQMSVISSRPGRRSEMCAFCVFYFYFPKPLRSLGIERCLSPKGISLALCYSSLRTPLTPQRNESFVNSVSQCSPLTQTQELGCRGGLRRRREGGRQKRLTAPASSSVRHKVTRSSHNLKREGG